MMLWINRLALAAVVVLTVYLAITAVPSLTSTHLGGGALMQHMIASGGLVLILPVYAILAIGRQLDPSRASPLERFGFWAVITTGFLTIATIFLCMLPIASTEVMDHLIHWHGYVGFAMVAALALFLVALALRRHRAQ